MDIKGTFGHNLDITWTPFGHCLDTLQVWTYFGHFLDTFWTYFGHFHIFGVQNLSIHTSFSSTESYVDQAFLGVVSIQHFSVQIEESGDQF